MTDADRKLHEAAPAASLGAANPGPKISHTPHRTLFLPCAPLIGTPPRPEAPDPPQCPLHLYIHHCRSSGVKRAVGLQALPLLQVLAWHEDSADGSRVHDAPTVRARREVYAVSVVGHWSLALAGITGPPSCAHSISCVEHLCHVSHIEYSNRILCIWTLFVRVDHWTRCCKRLLMTIRVER